MGTKKMGNLFRILLCIHICAIQHIFSKLPVQKLASLQSLQVQTKPGLFPAGI